MRTQPRRFWQCSICQNVGLWGPTWQSFSSFMVDDEWPSYRIIACSKPCEIKVEEGHQNETIKLPKFRCTGGASKMVRDQIGYKPQPSQSELVKIWNRENPQHQIATEFFK